MSEADGERPRRHQLDQARELLDEMQKAATPAEWYERVAGIVVDLMALRMWPHLTPSFTDPGDASRLDLLDAVREAIAAGPPKGRRKAVIQPSEDARIVQRLWLENHGRVPSRAEAVAYFARHELATVRLGLEDAYRTKIARDRAAKRVDLAVSRGGLKVTRRTKRK